MPAKPPRPFCVLVVDDEVDVRDLLTEYFRDRGCDVSAAADGRAAVSAIERAPDRFDLLVTDLQLPGLDGLGVLKAAKAANPALAVIIVTGFASLESAVEAVRLGADDYLAKPFSLGQLDVIVQRLAERRRLQAENRQLARQVGEGGGSGERRVQLASRLEALEARLIRIEEVLGLLVDRLGHR